MQKKILEADEHSSGSIITEDKLSRKRNYSRHTNLSPKFNAFKAALRN